jgi:hypothetical protein
VILVVPALSEKAWPSLGEQVCDWIEASLTFGPGDLLGQEARVDDELRAYIYALYQVYPKGHAEEGRRRIKRAGISLPKGSRKTEFAAWLAICELHPQGPVRTVDWSKRGQPIGGPVTDPFIPMVAYTEEQSEDLAYGAMYAILQQAGCTVAQDFDIGLSRILRLDGAGKAAPYASAPNSRDGARTTFQHFDETHHMTSDRLKKAHRAMLRNVPKRKIADGWTLETTTAPVPGAGSVAEEMMDYAKAVADGRVKDSSLFFYHRQASDDHDLSTLKGVRAAVKEARGPVASKWADLRAIVGQFKDPTADRSELARTWLNRPDKAIDRAFDATAWSRLAKPGYLPAKGALITLGFDGSRYEDATALVGTEVPTGFQWPLGIWEKPYGPEGQDWEVPTDEVNAAMERAFETWDVWKLYADPPYWETHVDAWAGLYGEERVVKWLTRLWRKIADACRAYANAIVDGDLSQSGDAAFARHIGNAHRRLLDMRDEDNRPVWIIQKERPGSPNKMDAAVAGVLSWRARLDALAAGVTAEEGPALFESRGLVVV